MGLSQDHFDFRRHPGQAPPGRPAAVSPRTIRPRPAQLPAGRVALPLKPPEVFLRHELAPYQGDDSNGWDGPCRDRPKATIGHQRSLFLARLPLGRALRPLQLPSQHSRYGPLILPPYQLATRCLGGLPGTLRTGH